MHLRERIASDLAPSATRSPAVLGSARLRLALHPRHDPALIAATALLARVAHAHALAQTPFFAGPIIDSKSYQDLATRIALHGDFGDAFYQPPLYPTIWALLLSFGIDAGWPLALAHCIAGAITALLCYGIGLLMAERAGRADARRIGLSCGLAAALYGPLILYDLEYLPPAWVHLLLAGAWVAALSRRAAVTLRDAWIGLLVGVATTGWALSAVFLVPIAWLRAHDVQRFRLRACLALALLAGTALPIAVVARHNAAAGSPGVLVSWNGGLNFWLGNNPDWRDTWDARPGPEFEAIYERPELAGQLTPEQRDRYFYRRALDDIRAHPLAALRRTAQKLYLFWHGGEIRRNQDHETLREASPVLRALLWEWGLHFPFGLVGPLALAGAIRRRREPAVRATIAAAVVYSVLVAAHIVASRYRLPLILWLLPLAVQEAVVLAGERQSRARVLGLLLIGLVLNWPSELGASFRAGPSERDLLRVHAWQHQRNLERAEYESRQLVKRFPQEAAVLALHADIVQERRGCRSALPILSRVADLVPTSTSLRVHRAQCYAELGVFHRAEEELRAALEHNPNSPQALRQAEAMHGSHAHAR